MIPSETLGTQAADLTNQLPYRTSRHFISVYLFIPTKLRKNGLIKNTNVCANFPQDANATFQYDLIR